MPAKRAFWQSPALPGCEDGEDRVTADALGSGAALAANQAVG